MLRAAAKTAIARLCHATGTPGLAAAAHGARGSPAVLAYHRVVPDFPEAARRAIPSLLVSVRTFAEHVEWLGRRFRFVSLDDPEAWRVPARRAERPAAAITFDDGYRDVYLHAFPLLRRKGIPAAVFVATDLVGTSRTLIHDAAFRALAHVGAHDRSAAESIGRILRGQGVPGTVAAEVARRVADPLSAIGTLFASLPHARIDGVLEAIRREYGLDDDAPDDEAQVDWRDLSELVRAGWTVGSHTARHVLLPQEDDGTLERELASSRRRIAAELGTTARHFAYPAGRFDGRSVAAVAGAGYGLAYTTCFHRARSHPELTIPRRVFWERTCDDLRGRFSGAMMDCQIHGVFDLRPRCRHDGRARGGAHASRAREGVALRETA